VEVADAAENNLAWRNLALGMRLGAIEVRDFDRDGDADVLGIEFDGNIVAMEFDHDSFLFTPPRVVRGLGSERVELGIVPGPRAVFDDFSGDGIADLLHVESDQLVFRRGGDDFEFAAAVVIAGVPANAWQLVDMDGDGDLDIFVEGDDQERIRLDWFENTGGDEPFLQSHTILDESVSRGQPGFFQLLWRRQLVDLDADGDLDVMLTRQIGSPTPKFEARDSWLEQVGASMFVDHVVGTRIDERINHKPEAIDMDDDGDADFALTEAGGEAAWYENLDGRGAFGEELQLGTPPIMLDNRPAVEALVDVDRDGDLDRVVAQPQNDRRVARTTELILWETDATSGATRTTIDTVEFVVTEIHVGDIDGDSLEDLVLRGGDSLAWLRNESTVPPPGEIRA
jgi:hypothetical protein